MNVFAPGVQEGWLNEGARGKSVYSGVAGSSQHTGSELIHSTILNELYLWNVKLCLIESLCVCLCECIIWSHVMGAKTLLKK